MGRAPCCDKNGLKKGPWTPEEDKKLIDYIQKHGYGNWRTLPKNAGLQRCGKSCRLRWTNYLRPDIKRGRFSFEEEETIIQLHSILGNKWSAIAARLPGRTDNEIKNYWNTHIRKRLLRMGIDPVTHSPRLDLLDISSILNSSLYNSSSHMNVSRFIGFQPLVNPELLRIATSLLSSQRETNHNYIHQNAQENQLTSPQMIQHLVQSNQNVQNQIEEIPCVQFPNDSQLGEPNMNEPINGDVSNITTFSSPSSQISEWQQSYAEDYVANLPTYNNTYYGSDQTLLDPSSETSTFQSNNSNHNFGFASVLSTPSSSPPPLNSNSTTTYNFNNNNNNSINDQDEHESYCSSMLKFEFQDLLDVNEFMM